MDESKNSSELPKAYVIAGHGQELLKSFIVPKGCTIVVDRHIGESQYGPKLNENYNKLCKIDDYKLKDPVTYSSDLLSEFKSLAIYKEGEECPQFNYQLVGCHLSPYYACDELNGIIDIDTFKQLSQCDIRRTHYSINDLNYVSSLYQYSVYPTKYEVEETLKSINLTTSGNSLLGTLFGHKLTNVSQEELCKKMPGVYYNFICRKTDLTSEINRNIKRTGINREPKAIFKWLTPEHNLRNTISKTISKEEHILRNTISKKISEAEKHRKPYIKKANNNKNATIRRQKNNLKNTNKNENNEFYNISYKNKNLRVAKIGVAKIEEAISTLKHDIKKIEEMIEKQTGIKSPIPGTLKYILSEKFRVLHKDKLLALKRIDIIDKNRKHKEKKSILSYIDNIGIKRKKILEYIDTLDKEKQSIVNTLELIETLDKSLKYKQILLEKYRQ